jgi:hypothetical protein
LDSRPDPTRPPLLVLACLLMLGCPDDRPAECRARPGSCSCFTDAGTVLGSSEPVSVIIVPDDACRTVDERLISLGSCGDYAMCRQFLLSRFEPGYIVQKVRVTSDRFYPEPWRPYLGQSCLNSPIAIDWTWWEAFQVFPAQRDGCPGTGITPIDAFSNLGSLVRDGELKVEVSARFVSCEELGLPNDGLACSLPDFSGLSDTEPCYLNEAREEAPEGECTEEELQANPCRAIPRQGFAGGLPATCIRPNFWQNDNASLINRSLEVAWDCCELNEGPTRVVQNNHL